jgi:hypothetical protein
MVYNVYISLIKLAIGVGIFLYIFIYLYGVTLSLWFPRILLFWIHPYVYPFSL